MRTLNGGRLNGRAWVRLCGTLSAPGRHGHMGAYAHAFTVSKILAVSAQRPPVGRETARC